MEGVTQGFSGQGMIELDLEGLKIFTRWRRMAKVFWAEGTEHSRSGGMLGPDAFRNRQAVRVLFEGRVNVRRGKRVARDEAKEGSSVQVTRAL